MSLPTIKPVVCRIPPATVANGTHSRVSKVTTMNRQSLPSFQVKQTDKPPQNEMVTATSRREMMQLTAASVGLLALLLPASAEARPRNATMRQKILEKLQELREKAGFSKTKDEEGKEMKPKDELGGKSKLHDGAKETNGKPKDEKKHATTPQPSTEEPYVPALPSIKNGKIVETTLP